MLTAQEMSLITCDEILSIIFKFNVNCSFSLTTSCSSITLQLRFGLLDCKLLDTCSNVFKASLNSFVNLKCVISNEIEKTINENTYQFLELA